MKKILSISLLLLSLFALKTDNTFAACATSDLCTTLGATQCQKSGGTNTGWNCTCVDTSKWDGGTFCNQKQWSCGTMDTIKCPVTGTGATPAPNKYCSGNGCAVSSLSSSCFVNHYRSNYKDDTVINDIVVKANVGSAYFTGMNCGSEQIDVYCSATGYESCGSRDNTGDCTRYIRYPVDCAPTPQPSSTTPSVPLNLAGVCNLTNSTITLSWSPSTNATSYLIRINNQTNDGVSTSCPNGWYCSDPPDKYLDNYVGTSYTMPIVVGQPYNWWIHGNNASGYSAAATGSFVCPASTLPPSKPLITPTPITAQCVSTRIYSPNWTQITNQEYSDIPAKSSVYFCVAGSSTGGSFDMARFTINGVLFANTTTMRPSSSDYCQLFTIPAGTYTTTVQGEVHHNTLGWL